MLAGSKHPGIKPYCQASSYTAAMPRDLIA